MIAVRREEARDHAEVRVVEEAAFGRIDEARIAEHLHEDAEAAGWVAEADGRVVAHAMLSRAHVGGEPVLLLGPVAVLPEAQRRGFGSAVVRAALSAATADGERLVLVLGSPAYYERFGFVPAADHGIPCPFTDAPQEDFQVLLLGGAPPSGEVTYHPAFDEF